ncbi:putative ester cyclase [Bradyrhizobium sp. F1.13.1]
MEMASGQNCESCSNGWRLILTLGCTSVPMAWSEPAQIPSPRRPLELKTETEELATCRRKVTTRRSWVAGLQTFGGATCNLNIVDELAAPDMLLQYSLHEPRRGRDDIKAFMTDFRKAFPDLNFWGAADLIAEGDYVVGRWEGGGTHTGSAFGDFLAGSLPANTGHKMKFTGTTVLKLKDGKIVEEIGLDDGVAAWTQLGLIKTAA